MSLSNEYPIRVRIIRDEDGEKVFKIRWHYISDWGDARRTLCGGEVFGIGEGRAEYKLSRGKITCEECIAIIKELKSVKL